MSSKKLNNIQIRLTFDQRINNLCEFNVIDGKEFAKLLGISAQYLTDIRHEKKIKGSPLKFWKGVRAKFPQWESYLRGEIDTPPDRDISIGQSFVSLADTVKDGGASPALTKVNIDELLFKAGAILTSKTVYSTALKSNIEAFHQAIAHDEALETANKRIDELEKLILHIQERLPAVGE